MTTITPTRHRHRLAVGVSAGDAPLCLRQRDISVRALHSHYYGGLVQFGFHPYVTAPRGQRWREEGKKNGYVKHAKF